MTALAATERDVENAHRAHELVSAGDVEGFMALCDPDVEFGSYIGQMEGRRYRGREGVREWIAELREGFPDFETAVQDVEAVGDDLVIEVRLSGSGAASGVGLEQTVYQRVTLREGLVTRWNWFSTRRQAMSANWEFG